MKSRVHDYWNARPCGTEFGRSTPFSMEYFQEIENHRYTLEKEILSFAQFTRYRGLKVLEVGVGAGVDFTQWVRAGAKAYGVDFTESAINHTSEMLKAYGLMNYALELGDAERLPCTDNSFDLVYSWGVIHHTPDTEKALSEIIRVTKPGGTCKIMVYNRHSILAYHRWVLSICNGQFKSISSILAEKQESIGTKAYTEQEFRRMLSRYPVNDIVINSPVIAPDLFTGGRLIMRAVAYVAACVLGWHKAGWFMMVEFKKV